MKRGQSRGVAIVLPNDGSDVDSGDLAVLHD
jgi:hypothetical protein